MRRFPVLAAALAALVMAGCGGSSEKADPGTDPGLEIPPTEDVVADATPEAAEEAFPETAGEDEGLSEETAADAVEDVPSGPLIPKEEGDLLTVDNGVITLVYNLANGTFNLSRVPGQDGLVNAHSEAVLNVQGARTVIASSDAGPRIQYQVLSAPDELGEAVNIRFDAVPNNKIGGVATYIILHRDTPAVTFRTIVAMPFSADVEVLEIRPVVARHADGATLHLGPGTSDAVLVDNGSEVVLDMSSDAQVVGELSPEIVGEGLSSNWSAVLCTAAKSCAVAGFVTTNKAFALVSTDQQSGEAVEIGGEEGLTLFSMRSRFTPPAALDAGRTQTSDIAYVDLTDDPHQALLRYGRAIATFNGRQPSPVAPSSWNSWAGGGGSGGQGADIDETFILQNLDAAVRDFLPYGMDYFCIDDGWQRNDGTWTTDTTRFPKHGAADGMAWMAQQVTDAGFLPGIWVAPFRAGKDWPIVTQHPDWILPLDDLGTMALGGGSTDVILDPSNDEVKAYLREIFTRITKDWGYRFVKLDYSVYAMLGATYKTAGRSGLSLYKEALRSIREAIGDDVFLLVVAGTGVNWGIADGQRLTLDNLPHWGAPMLPTDQGVKATVRTAAHRYWIGNTVWSNHPDLLFFRDNEGLTWDEAKAFALFVSVQGGFVKLGDSFTFMAEHPEALSLVERMVPPLATFPEPLDFFRMRWPEVWRVPLAAGTASYEAFGLFNWGMNRDVPAQMDLEETTRDLEIPPQATGSSLGPTAPRVFLDSLEGTLLAGDGDVALRPGAVTVTMAPRTSRVLLAHPVAGLDGQGPVFLGTDRHVMGGASVVEVAADGTDGTKVAFTKGVPGRETKVYFLVAKGASVDVQPTDATGVSQAMTSYADADLVAVTLTTTSATASVTARYQAP